MGIYKRPRHNSKFKRFKPLTNPKYLFRKAKRPNPLLLRYGTKLFKIKLALSTAESLREFKNWWYERWSEYPEARYINAYTYRKWGSTNGPKQSTYAWRAKGARR